MNTKWEEELREISSLFLWDEIEYGNVVQFIKDQITEAHNKGFHAGRNSYGQVLDGEQSAKASSDMPERLEDDTGNTNVCNKHKAFECGICGQLSVAKQAQQEIAEQIIEDIPDRLSIDDELEIKQLKDQLRFKYLNENNQNIER